MKKTEMETVWCAECQPFIRFDPPNAAEQLLAHYEAGKHQKRKYDT